MSALETRSPQAVPDSDRTRPPSVLVVLVVKDGAPWLRRCLVALSRQTHPRIGVLAVDNGSSDGSAELLEEALGPERVLRLERNLGFGGAVRRALETEVAGRADYVLLLHDDVVLAPHAVARMVEAAEAVEGCGVVGPKVLDWEGRGILLEVGSSSDRFGYAYSPLEEGEIDHGQYDRMRDVLFVSSVAMLVSRRAWSTVGPLDERFTSYHESLDFCWRARLAGFRVLMVPGAVALHRGATLRGERPGSVAEGPRRRYHRERGALASMLKNYSLPSLLWVLPLYLVVGVARVAALVVARRLNEASQVLAAWGWNLAHLPGTVRRRRRAQSVRRVPDRVLRRSMAPVTLRLRRWAAGAAQALLPAWTRAREAGVPAGARLARLAVEHPAALAWVAGAVLALASYRGLIGADPLVGGALGEPPPSPVGYFRELLSGVRTTGLGGPHPASPALALLGAGSAVALGSPALLQKLLLLALPAAAALGCGRAVGEATGRPAAGVVAGALYGLSGPVLWALSTGRLEVLVILAGTPWLVTKVSLAFHPDLRRRVAPTRWVAGAALGAAVLASFFPGTALALALTVAVWTLAPVRGARRGRGVALSALALAGSAALLLPLSVDLVRTGGAGLGHRVPPVPFSSALRLALGPGPGQGWAGAVLPLAAALSLPFLPPAAAGAGVRAAGLVVAGVYLSWASAAGLLPAPVSNAPAYAGLAAFGSALLVGAGLGALLPGVTASAFGHRQVAAGLLVLAVAVGLGGQAVRALRADWEVGGPDRVPPAYTVVEEAGPGRVLWLGTPRGDAFPAPGGLPDGVVRAGGASVRYAVRPAAGASALDVGRAAGGDGYRALEAALAELLSGSTRHGGALLAPFGVRFVVADPRDLPELAWRRLLRQVDLDPVPVGGLRVLQDPKAVPLASVVVDRAWVAGARGSASAALDLPAPAARGFDPPHLEGGAGPGALVLLSQDFDPRWRLEGPDGAPRLRPVRAFGWATGFTGTAVPPRSRLVFGGQGAHALALAVAATLWAGAVVATRRPPRGA
jgi:GT2 family glycosyltransferase